ncbi:MAG: OB-fold nucleic acid binding domain-containing protein [Candidatus Nanoarchaeia archaeon]|nr:OB-fold nucleic acid binding domain-containing protein [Candidatus Nanoarchaeia archaeon]
MENNQLFNLSLVVSIFGIFCLLLLAENLELKETPIKDINYKLMDQRVKTSGYIDRIFETKGLYLLDLKNNSSKITVLIFKKENITLLKNSYVSVEGTVTEYKNQTEIIAKKVLLK